MYFLTKNKIKKTSLIYSNVIVLLLLASSLIAKIPDFKLIYEGYLPEPIYYIEERTVYTRELKLADLLGEGQDFIVIKDKNVLKILQFVVKSNWKSFYEIVTDDSSLTEKWVTGDLDNNGRDEIILFKERTMIKYEWDGKEFKKVVNKLPYFVGDALIGDINNDKENELAVFCYERPLKEEDGGRRCYLCIIKTEKDSLHFLWTDKGEIIYMPNKLVCIADVDGTNSRQLVIAEPQSDVSPTRYNLLRWSENKLEIVKSFIIAKGDIITEGHTEESPFLHGHFKPIDIKGTGYFLGCVECAPDSLHRYMYFQTVIFEMKNGFKILKALDEACCTCSNYETSIINLDGKGKGVMILDSKRENEFNEETESSINPDVKKGKRAHIKGEKMPDYKTRYLFYR